MATKIFYLMFLSIPGVTAYYATIHKKNKRKIWMLLTIGLYFFLLATTTGYSDLEQYKYHFETSAKFFNYAGYYFKHYRLPFFAFNAVVRIFTDNFWIYNAVWAFVISAFLYAAWMKMADEISLHWSVIAFSMVYFLHLVSGKRFTLAFAFVMLGMAYYTKRQNIKFFLCIVIAAMFHISAAVIFFFWGAEVIFSSGFFRRNRWIVFILFILLIVAEIIYREKWMEIITYINDSGYAAGEFELGMNFGIGWLMYWLPGFLIYYVCRPYMKDRGDKVRFLTAIGVTVVISSIGYMVYGLARVNVLLIFVDLFWIPYAFRKMEIMAGNGSYTAYENQRFIKFFFMLYLLFRFFSYMAQMAYSSKMIPYQNIFGITL